MGAVKVLISGYEASGKSTVVSKLKDALIVNCDNKDYTFKVMHTSLKEYTGILDFQKFISDKIMAYKDKVGEYPKYLVLDTVTQLYTSLVKYANTKYKNFAIHTEINKDTLAINTYLENKILANGISVVIVAHTTVDPDTGRYVIPASGQFAKAGSWLSVVNEALFLDKSTGKIKVKFRSLTYPCRTTYEEFPDEVDIKDFDINDYMGKLESNETDVSGYKL